jgi:hypothetical protein
MDEFRNKRLFLLARSRMAQNLRRRTQQHRLMV